LALAESQKLALTIVTIIVVALILGFLMYSSHKVLKETVEANDKLTRETEKLKIEKIAKIPQKKAALAKLQKNAPVYRSMFPPVKGESKFNDFIELCRKKTKMMILSIEEKRQTGSGRQRTRKATTTYSYELKMMGTFDQFCSFMSMLEAHGYEDYLRFIKVDKFNIKKEDEDENEQNINDIKLTVSMMSYAALERKVSSKKKQPARKGGGK